MPGPNAGKAKRKSVGAAGDQGNTSTAPAKRQRVSRACDQCRAAREKCDGIQPVCFTCASNNRDCSYTANPKKRGIQPGYIKSLELSLAWVFSNVPGSEEALRLLLTQDPSGPSLLVGKENEKSYKLHKRWRKSAICKELERLLSGDQIVTGRPTSPTIDSDDDGNDSPPQDFTFAEALDTKQRTTNSIGDYSVRTGPQLDALSGYKGSPMEISLSFEDQPLNTTGTALENQKHKLRLPSNLWQLFDVYFAYTHCWLPIIEKNNTLKLAYSYPSEGLERGPELASGAHAELWSILAVASMQVSCNGGPSNDACLSAQGICEIARGLIPTENDKMDIGHVKAVLLLCLVNLSQQNITSAWFLVGYAVRIALSLELHRHIERDTEKERTRAKHVFLGCFILDTLISAHMGHAPHLRRLHIKIIDPLDEDGLEEWQPWESCHGFGIPQDQSKAAMRSPVHALSTFNQIVHMAAILNDTISIGGSSAVQPQSECLQELKRQIQHLPSGSLIRSGNLSASPTPPALTARLIYLTVLASSDTLSDDIIGQVLKIFERYRDAFGLPTMPSIFISLFTVIHQQASRSASNLKLLTQLRGVLTATANIWCIRKLNRPEHSLVDDGRYANNTVLPDPINQYRFSLLGSLHQPPQSNIFANPVRMGTNELNSTNLPPQPNRFPDEAMQQPPSNNNLRAEPPGVDEQSPVTISHPPTYDGPPLERYNSAGSIDVDALFDELASLDDPEKINTRPQFMQNLGFAPDADLADFFSADFGQIDPTFNAYLQNNVGGNAQQVVNFSQPFDGG